MAVYQTAIDDAVAMYIKTEEEVSASSLFAEIPWPTEEFENALNDIATANGCSSQYLRSHVSIFVNGMESFRTRKTIPPITSEELLATWQKGMDFAQDLEAAEWCDSQISKNH